MRDEVEARESTPETIRQLEIMRALYDISVEISSRLETQKVMQSVVHHAAQLLNATGSTLAVCEPETNLARVVALYNVPYDYEELILRPGASVASQVLVTGKPVIINNINKDNSGKRELKKSSENYSSILSVPLIWDSKISGALTVIDCQGGLSFGENDAQLLCLLANMAGTAINNANLFSQVMQLNQHLEQKVQERTQELNNAQEELKKLHATTVFLQEEERTRISRELHDGSNQLITGTLYEIQAAESCLRGGQPEVAIEWLETAKVVLRQIDAENRRIITGLRPMALDTHGLFDAIRKLVNASNNMADSKCHLNIQGDLIRFEPQVEISIYRIIQESLQNATEHSNAGNIDVNLDISQEFLTVKVCDNGKGFSIDDVAASERMGLIGMRERAQIIGGSLELVSNPGNGTTVSFTLPLTAEITRTDSNTADFSDRKKYKKTKHKKIKNDASMSEKASDSIVQEIAQAIEIIEEKKVIALVRQAIQSEVSPLEILQKGIMEGLKAIGSKLDSEVYSLGELLIATKLAEDCIKIIEPYLPRGSNLKHGVIVIGAVQGDIHSIGYGMVALMLQLAGYEVHSLGVNVPSNTFVDKAIELKADIIGLSAFLITTIPYCLEVIKDLESKGIRDKYKVIIGGSKTDQAFADSIGADGWSPDAFEAIRLCNRLLKSDE